MATASPPETISVPQSDADAPSIRDVLSFLDTTKEQCRGGFPIILINNTKDKLSGNKVDDYFIIIKSNAPSAETETSQENVVEGQYKIEPTETSSDAKNLIGLIRMVLQRTPHKFVHLIVSKAGVDMLKELLSASENDNKEKETESKVKKVLTVVKTYALETITLDIVTPPSQQAKTTTTTTTTTSSTTPAAAPPSQPRQPTMRAPAGGMHVPQRPAPGMPMPPPGFAGGMMMPPPGFAGGMPMPPPGFAGGMPMPPPGFAGGMMMPPPGFAGGMMPPPPGFAGNSGIAVGDPRTPAPAVTEAVTAGNPGSAGSKESTGGQRVNLFGWEVPLSTVIIGGAAAAICIGGMVYLWKQYYGNDPADLLRSSANAQQSATRRSRSSSRRSPSSYTPRTRRHHHHRHYGASERRRAISASPSYMTYSPSPVVRKRRQK